MGQWMRNWKFNCSGLTKHCLPYGHSYEYLKLHYLCLCSNVVRTQIVDHFPITKALSPNTPQHTVGCFIFILMRVQILKLLLLLICECGAYVGHRIYTTLYFSFPPLCLSLSLSLPHCLYIYEYPNTYVTFVYVGESYLLDQTPLLLVAA